MHPSCWVGPRFGKFIEYALYNPLDALCRQGSQTYSQEPILTDDNLDWKKEQVLKRKLKKASEKAEKLRKLDTLAFEYACPIPICKKMGKSFDGAEQFVHHVYVDSFANME